MADTKENIIPLTAPGNENKPTGPPTQTAPGAALPLTEEPEKKVESKEGTVLPLKSDEPAAENKPKESEQTATEPSGSALPLTEGPAVEKDESASKEPFNNGDGWPELEKDHRLVAFYHALSRLTGEAKYDEVYGIHLGTTNSFHTKLILQKFLRANINDLEKAKTQLLKTLKWRREFQPLKTLEETYDQSRFGGLGYVVELTDVPEDGKAIATFNLYGAVKDNKKTFGDLESFLRWRVALMELSLSKLALPNATKPIPDFGAGPDPYQAFQIHDYMSVSFLRRDPVVKAATDKTIQTFSDYYPETLSRKFFVNVPSVMGWVFAAVKLVLPKETVRKFTVMSYGNALAGELGPGVPEQYGGKGKSLEEAGEGPKMWDETSATTTEPEKKTESEAPEAKTTDPLVKA